MFSLSPKCRFSLRSSAPKKPKIAAILSSIHKQGHVFVTSFNLNILSKDPLHKWRLHLNNSTYTSLASHSWEKSFILKHEYEAKDVSSVVIQI